MTAPTSGTERPRFAYIPTFDGMRGFWVILGPLLYHARPTSIPGGPDIVPGGILSLDLFFVLSSYLIVSIALREWEGTGRLDLVAYAGRRVRRLFPALFLVLGFLSIYLAVIDDPELIDRWTGAIVSALTYSANWHEVVSGVSYFEQFRTPSPLKHVWSFAIEEQFYLFAPFFIIAGLTWGGRRGREVLLALSVIGALWSAWWMARVHVVGEDPSRAYYGTDTRAQALFVGIAMALAINLYGSPRSVRGTRLVALLAYPATAFHLWAVLFVSERDSWLFERGGFLLIAVAAGVALWGMSQPAPWSPLHRLFASSSFRYAGRISYGLYLYHWPIYLLVTPERAGSLFGTDRITGWTLLSFHLLLTVAVSVASFHLLEQPFVKRRWPWSDRSLTLPAGAFAGAAAIVVILGGLLYAFTNKPPVVEQILVPSAAAADPSDDADGLGAEPADPDGDSVTTPDPGDGALPRVLTVSDSVADQIGVALVDWTIENPGRMFAFNEAHIGCGIVRDGLKRVPEGDEGPVGEVCSMWADPVDPSVVSEYDIVSWPTVLEEFDPDIVVGHVSPWDVTDRIVPTLGDEWTHVGDPAYDAHAYAEYRAATELLASTGADVYWFAGAYLNRPIVEQNDPARIDALNEIVATVIADVLADLGPDAPVIELVDYPAFVGEVGSDRELSMRDDGVHLSDDGLVEMIPWLLDDTLGLDIVD